jgi:hypothetical protein
MITVFLFSDVMVNLINTFTNPGFIGIGFAMKIRYSAIQILRRLVDFIAIRSGSPSEDKLD